MKLFNSIDEVKINGSPAELNQIVCQVDKDITDLSDDTAQLANDIKKHFEFNKGDQYRKLGEAAKSFSQYLEKQTIEMNECQREMQFYMEKAVDFEEKKEDIFNVKTHNVETAKADLETNQTFVSFESIVTMQKRLVEYSENTKTTLSRLNSEKEQTRSYWFDKQYNTFSSFIDDVISTVKKALEIFDAYADHLQKQITALHNR